MLKKPSRDWDAERQQLASALTQLEIIKSWLMEHQQSAPELAKELEKLTARLSKFGEINGEGMVRLRLGIDSERWQQFSEACNANAGQELSPEAVETRAFYLWVDMIDKVIEHYKVKENNGPVILTIWVK